MVRRKKPLLSLLLAFVLVLSLAAPALAAEGMVAINETNFPDAVFRSYVAKNFDTNKDNKLSAAERNAVVEIDVINGASGETPIATLDGIAFFPNLKILRCVFNDLTTLDLSRNAALTELHCAYNSLTSLDLSKNTALEILYCGGNNLLSLDVSKNTALKDLWCGWNLLTSLELGNNTVLKSLDCGNNMLKSLDVSRNTALTELTCNNNQLTSLDLSKNTALKTLDGMQNVYNAIVGPGRTFDMSVLPGGLNVSRTTDWSGGSVSGNILTVDAGASEVTYTYNTGSDYPLTVTLKITVAEHPDGDVILRMYNPGNGKHHYTNGVQEANTLIAGGWKYEGIGWIAPKEGAPIYRVYNPGNDNHLYTMDAAERDNLVAGGWVYEGILCYSAGTDGVPLYRVFNPYVTLNPHHYTDSLEECEFLKSNGWIVEGISWYGLSK